MDPLWLTAAFVLGFGAFLLRLPPMVGYLAAGFLLQALGVTGGPVIAAVADLGVLLLLFTIGLKLRLRDLAQPEVYAGTTIHMVLTVAGITGLLLLLAQTGLWGFAGLTVWQALLIGFALSFSSTVFAVKVLEDRAESAALHGRVAVAILIMQDLFAVVFLTVSTGQLPSPWALGLLVGLVALRPLLFGLLNRVGHRELLLLFAVFLALGVGAEGFIRVGMKPGLGALLVGVLVAGHPKAKEMADALMGFKDLFLVGFFLSIGLGGGLVWQTAVVGALLLLAVPFKAALFFWLMTRFKLRARTSLLTSLSLANYSEFGLLVALLGAQQGWLGPQWLAILAVAVSLSFLAASPLNSRVHALYGRFAVRLRRWERQERKPEEAPIDPGDAQVAVCGMGRLGTSAYDALREKLGDRILGVDFDRAVVERHRRAGRHVITGDPTDRDFWERMQLTCSRLEWVLLAMASQQSNVTAIHRMQRRAASLRIAVVTKFPDEESELREAGAAAVYNVYAEAGFGFAEHVHDRLSRDNVLECVE